MAMYITITIVAFASLVLVNLKYTKLHSGVCLLLLLLSLALLISLPLIVLNNTTQDIDYEGDYWTNLFEQSESAPTPYGEALKHPEKHHDETSKEMQKKWRKVH